MGLTKKNHFLVFGIMCCIITNGLCQVLPNSRSVKWISAGYNGIIPNYTTIVNINNYGGDSTGSISNNNAFTNAVNSLSGVDGVVYFPPGVYLFDSKVQVGSGLILRGASSDSTLLRFGPRGR